MVTTPLWRMHMPFPNPDPIPLPAPVWVFKSLHITTLTLHFAAVYLLVGGLLLATLWNYLGRRNAGSALAGSASALAHRMPILMTYLINLGIPPLLFAQVLYGQALYTSSVLIGAYWIAVIFLLMAGYYLLYLVNQRDEEGRTWWWLSLISLMLIAYIGRIYAANMALMIRPEAWLEMYRAEGGAAGRHLPSGDPTILPRWLFMMIGSIGFGGLLATIVAALSKTPVEVRKTLRRWGGTLAAIFLPLQMGIGWWAWQAQPAFVRERVLDSPYRYAVYLWVVVSVLTALAALAIVLLPRVSARVWPFVACLCGLLSIAAGTTVRDGIRDLTLLIKGFDVWSQPVVANWSVVILFLILFVGGLVVIGWMVRVAFQSKTVEVKHG